MDDEDIVYPTKITEHVYLGCIKSTKSAKVLNELQIRRIITVDIEPLKYINVDGFADLKYLYINAYDHQFEDLITKFEECLQFINEGIRSSNDKVLVHCHAGLSRSATIVIAYVMIKKKITAQRAISYVINKRTIVAPNYGFVKQLELFEKMNYNVISNNLEFRQFLLKHLQYKIQWSQPWNIVCQSPIDNLYQSPIDNPLRNYFRKLQKFLPKNDVQKQEKYKCKKCRLFLFKQLNVIHNLDAPKRTNCDNIFIEPQEWMLPSISQNTFGQMNCPNCLYKIGSFDWNSLNCKCDVHNDLNCLIFKIDSKKVDFHNI